MVTCRETRDSVSWFCFQRVCVSTCMCINKRNSGSAGIIIIIIIIIRQLIRRRNMSIKSLQGRRMSCGADHHISSCDF